MKRFFAALKRYFMPSDSATTLLRILPLVTIAFLMIILFVFTNVAWEYTNATTFCGLTCHTMPPQYVTHQNSVHAKVNCEDCHMGRDVLGVMIPRKIMYSWQTGSAMVLNSYEYPIVAKNMRPALDACENCHKPETFTSDKLVEIKHFASNETNTVSSTYLALKIGGGSQRQGLGLGIHWHVENPVYFYATDRERQIIPYVLVVNPDGTKTEYVDTEAGIDSSMIKATDLQKMDCITCHNRTAHGVSNPNSTVDQLMARDLVSPKIPNIKAKAVEVISADYKTVKAATDAIADLDKFYQSSYADFYSANKALLTSAIKNIQDRYVASNFPDQKFDWRTHPNNIGHTDSIGCMRCHDGKHLTKANETIRLECNVCHSVPVVTGANKVNANLQLNRGFEPESHQNSNWISLHRSLLDNSCKGCHTTDDPGGTSNKSFCSNSACHGAKFTYAGYDAPKVRQILATQVQMMITPSPVPTATPEVTSTPELASTPQGTPDPKATPQAPSGSATFEKISAIFTEKCSSCHGSNGMKGLDLTSYTSVMKGSQDGPVVIAGDPDNSLLVKVQSAADPHFGQASADELALVKSWILAGAKEK
jgi:nitrate/TMAO reductase-like tetraheme cytochrome c subunit